MQKYLDDFFSVADTQREAFKAIKPKRRSLREIIYDYIRVQGREGATVNEVEVNLEINRLTAGARVNELMKAGKIMDSGRRRATDTGRTAIVWVRRRLVYSA